MHSQVSSFDFAIEMDSVLGDIEFLMNLKQETPSSNEHAGPLAEGAHNNDTEQMAMSSYMTDFILDYINRSLKVRDVTISAFT